MCHYTELHTPTHTYIQTDKIPFDIPSLLIRDPKIGRIEKKIIIMYMSLFYITYKFFRPCGSYLATNRELVDQCSYWMEGILLVKLSLLKIPPENENCKIRTEGSFFEALKLSC